jgi:Zn-dependent peptidase ImmA (M78 family)
MLLWAREAAGLSVQEAARKAATKPERLEQWERGELRPTVTQLRKLADVYKRPVAVFFLQKRLPPESFPSDFRKLDPDRAEPLSPELRLAIRQARRRRLATLELLQELGEQPADFTLRTRVGEDPDKIADKLRNALGIPETLPAGDARQVLNRWREAAERAGILVFQAEDVALGEARGFSLGERPLPAVVVNIQDAPQARSFTLAHEITHLMLGMDAMCALAETGPDTEARRVEVFCNAVAGAALVPAASLLVQSETPKRRVASVPDEAVEVLARRYGVSPEMVLRRFVALERVAPSFYQQKRQEYLRRYEALRLRQRGGFAPPPTVAVAVSGRRFCRLVLDAYDERLITGARSYSIDTSALIEAWVRSYPLDVFPTLWKQIEQLIRNGRLTAIDEVLRELERKVDDLFKWAKAQSLLFVPLDATIQKEAIKIINRFSSLTDPNAMRGAADPFVIALAQVKSLTVVTAERSKPAKPRIPDVCKTLSIPCFTLLELFREEGWIV